MTKSREKVLDAATQLDCATGNGLIVGTVANGDLTVQLRPHRGHVQNGIRFAGGTSTAGRRLVALSFAASSLPARVVVLGPGHTVVASHRFASTSARCAGGDGGDDDDDKFLFGWL